MRARALNYLINYDWPGNVRELENCIQRALVLTSSDILHLKDVVTGTRFSQPLSLTSDGKNVLPLKELERQAIFHAIYAAGGDKRLAAQMLEIGTTTIYRKLKEYGNET